MQVHLRLRAWNMGKFGWIAAVLCLCSFFLTGCGDVKVPDTIDTPTASVGKKGQITVWQVGEFDKDDYILSELEAMAVDEVARFNEATHKGAASVESVEALPDGSGKVVVEYRFDGWESCGDFLEEDFFFGTVKEAGLRGFDLKVDMKDAQGGGALTGQLGQSGDKYLLITDMKGDIYSSYKASYISVGAVLNQDGSVDTSGVEGFAYILFQ